MKRLIFLLLVMALLPFAAAFANGDREAETAADGSVSLHVFHFKVTWIDSWNAATDRYVAEVNPNVSF